MITKISWWPSAGKRSSSCGRGRPWPWRPTRERRRSREKSAAAPNHASQPDELRSGAGLIDSLHECTDARFDALSQPVHIVPALEHRHEAAFAVLTGDVLNDARQIGKSRWP